MWSLTYREEGSGLQVLVTVWDPEDVITTVLAPIPNPPPEVALRPAGAGRWGPPLRLVEVQNTQRGA